MNRFLLVVAQVLLLVALTKAAPKPKPLPVFFFHGVMRNSTDGVPLQVNLTAQGHVYVPVTSCEGVCSIRHVNDQVQLAITQIRSIIKGDARFDDGYVFVGHSQGGMLARSVIEEMDDHKVRVLVSLAGLQNGLFYGTQAADAIPRAVFATQLGPALMDPSLFDFSKYTEADLASGKMQCDFDEFWLTGNHSKIPSSVIDMTRPPVEAKWRELGQCTPVYNNLNPCTGPTKFACLADQRRRKANFLRLKHAHFFASPGDGVISPWQSSIFGHYATVNSVTELRTKYQSLQVLDMKATDEYKLDSFGLKTLDMKKGLHLYTVPNITHGCWLGDPPASCDFKPLYDKYIYPAIVNTV